MEQKLVFVSHLTIEARFADLLKRLLTKDFIGLLRFFVSTDVTSIPVGTQWFDGLQQALRSADLQLVVCSPQSVEKPWINYEAGAASVGKARVIPLCHSGMTPARLPVPLSMSEGVVLTEPAGLQKLYTTISEALGTAVPVVPFKQYAAEVRKLEQAYALELERNRAASNTPTDESIGVDPYVLCVTSPQYLELGFENQLQTVLDALPPTLRHDRVTTSQALGAALLRGRTDIVHLAAYVCPRIGDVYFSRVYLPRGRPAAGAVVDLIHADRLAALLKEAGTRLVVLGSGDSLPLVMRLLPITNVIAPSGIVSASALALWIEMFYRELKTRPLAKACERAGMASNAAMRLLTQQSVDPSDGRPLRGPSA